MRALTGLFVFGDKNLMKTPVISISHVFNNYKIIKMKLNQLTGPKVEIFKDNILHHAAEIRLCIFIKLKVKICFLDKVRQVIWNLNSM